MVYTPSHRPQRGFQVPAVLVRADMGEDTEIYASGVRWVAVRVLSHAVLIISAHARQSVLSYSETLQEITCCLERFKSAFPRHHVVLGAYCNVSFEWLRRWSFCWWCYGPFDESQIVCRR